MALTKSGNKLVTRFFTKEGENVFDNIKWENRKAYIFDAKKNKPLLDMEVEAPDFWDDTAVNIAAYKYLRKKGVPTPAGKETSVRQLVDRVAYAITQTGEELGYFDSPEESKIFNEELIYLLIHQKAAFNSPVWFNVGLFHRYGIESKTNNFYYNPETKQAEKSPNAYLHPQCSACFIQLAEDSLEGIFELLTREARLFKFGSGTGTNFSTIRSKREELSNGGYSSGLLSFLKVFDTAAGSIKSGGTTRRAAKMVIVNIDHPEIEDFIKWKSKEEDKAVALIREGYDADFNGEAYQTIAGQNANNSVRVTDEFMQAYLNDGEWQTKAITTGEVIDTYKARDLMDMISKSAWRSAEPGMQFDSIINRWNTCKESGKINASNPCSEFMFLDDSACNLASLNLVAFMDDKNQFDVEAYRRAIDILILAQEIIVGFASYPYVEMAENSNKFRPLGLGYANLGAYLMRSGLSYDSDAGRGLAATMTAIMTGRAYAVSAMIAERLGAFSEYDKNSKSMLQVIEMHTEAAREIKHAPEYLKEAAVTDFEEALSLGRQHGYRNAQTTVLAPTGTIGPLMSVDTTGVEPDYALVKYKSLAGGGGYSIVNQSVEPTLKHLGYGQSDIDEIKKYILDNNKIEGAPNLQSEYLPIFDCASRCGDGERFLRPIAHIEMMAAVQPFVSGAISKTVNMPNEATQEEVEQIYLEAWKRGLKSLAIYRDGSKASQPLVSKKKDKQKENNSDYIGKSLDVASQHRDMPKTREGLTHKFSIGDHKIYITANRFKEGDLGEIFITAGKEGSVVSGLLGTIARLSSKMMQEGVPAESIVNSLLNLRFDPWGMTDNPDIPMAKSIPDYIGRWLGKNFLPLDKQVSFGIADGQVPVDESEEGDGLDKVEEKKEETVHQPVLSNRADVKKNGGDYAPPCPTCGALMIRNGSCFACKECGTTTGCS